VTRRPTFVSSAPTRRLTSSLAIQPCLVRPHQYKTRIGGLPGAGRTRTGVLLGCDPGALRTALAEWPTRPDRRPRSRPLCWTLMERSGGEHRQSRSPLRGANRANARDRRLAATDGKPAAERSSVFPTPVGCANSVLTANPTCRHVRPRLCTPRAETSCPSGFPAFRSDVHRTSTRVEERAVGLAWRGMPEMVALSVAPSWGRSDPESAISRRSG
jgi:hypothetical protein